MRTTLLLILGLALLVLACGRPSVGPYLAPRQVERDWASVLANPRPVRWVPLRTGTFHVPDKAHFLDGPAETVARYEQTDDALPVYAHAIEHDELGLHLVDAGFGAEPDEHLGRIMARLLERNGRWFDVPPGENLASKLGPRRGDVRSVFLTHLHFDHVSGVTDLPESVRVVVGPYAPTMPTRVAMGDYLDGRQLEALDFDDGHVMDPLGRAIDLLGDQSLWAIETRGHTLGHVSFLVNGADPVLLTGDVVHFGWAYEHDVPSISMGGDPADQRESLDRIREFVRRFPEVKLVFGHEIPKDTP